PASGGRSPPRRRARRNHRRRSGVGPARLRPAAGAVIALLQFRRVVERNVLAYRRQWFLFASGFAEPFLYLLSIRIGVGNLVGTVGGVPYREFVAPGMMAAATMNGSIFDTTFNFFAKLKYLGIYDSMLATPLVPSD